MVHQAQVSQGGGGSGSRNSPSLVPPWSVRLPSPSGWGRWWGGNSWTMTLSRPLRPGLRARRRSDHSPSQATLPSPRTAATRCHFVPRTFPQAWPWPCDTMTQPSPPDTGYFRTGISCAAMAFLGFVNGLPQPPRHPKTGAKFRTTPDAPSVQTNPRSLGA